MTQAELLREARAIVPPAGASKAIAVVDEQLHHRAAFLLHDRIRSAPVGPAFAKPRAAGAFIDLLNGDRPATRPGSDDFAGSGDPSSEDARVQPGMPAGMTDVPVQDPVAVAHPVAAAGVRTCEMCGEPLPAGSRSHRRTDTEACRRALGRRAANAGRVDAQGARGVVPLSRPSQDGSADPTARAGARGRLLRASARDAGPDPSPGDQPLPTLGLL